MAYLYINQAFNIHVGDDGPDNDKSLILGNLSFPDLEEMTATHHPGGSRFGLNLGGMGMNPFVVKFGSNGWDPQSLSKFGNYTDDNPFYTLRAHVRNRNGNAPVAVKCVTRGRMTKISTSNMTRGSMTTFDHEINEIDIYQLFFDNAPKYNFSFFDHIYEVDGVPQNASEVLNLGIG